MSRSKHFANGPLRALTRYCGVDAVYEKIRAGRQVQNMAVAVVVGLDEAGRRDILAVEPMYEESEATYHVLFEKLKERGLKNVWLVVLPPLS